MKKIYFQKTCLLPDDDYSCEQHEVSISDILSGNFDVSGPSLDFNENYDDNDDDYDEQCRLLDDVDKDYEQRVFDEMREEASHES